MEGFSRLSTMYLFVFQKAARLGCLLFLCCSCSASWPFQKALKKEPGMFDPSIRVS